MTIARDISLTAGGDSVSPISEKQASWTDVHWKPTDATKSEEWTFTWKIQDVPELALLVEANLQSS
jgi:hypothetical protein